MLVRIPVSRRRFLATAAASTAIATIGGVARLERIPEKPYEEFLVAIAGPLVNVVIAIALIVVAGAQLNIGDLYAVESPDASMVDRLAAVNLFLAVFNMIPAFPMDGGRVLRALLAARLGYVRATKVAAFIGQGVAFALGVIGVFSNPMLIFIAVFVYLAASSEAHAVALRAMSHGLPVSAAMTTHFATLTPAARLEDAAQVLLRTSQTDFPVIDAAGRPVGILGRDDLMRALKQLGPHARVIDTMTTGVPTIGQRRRLDEAFRLLQESSAPAVAVVDDSGRLVGLVTSETASQMLTLKKSLPKGARLGPWTRATGA